mmetsp:Transcript_69473/g.192265  ORF Transcript_69473/g.192265 Transcript_69473/m.192265 type:complete len:252 (-) Transcript_69473:3-758(-)
MALRLHELQRLQQHCARQRVPLHGNLHGAHGLPGEHARRGEELQFVETAEAAAAAAAAAHWRALELSGCNPGETAEAGPHKSKLDAWRALVVALEETRDAHVRYGNLLPERRRLAGREVRGGRPRMPRRPHGGGLAAHRLADPAVLDLHLQVLPRELRRQTQVTDVYTEHRHQPIGSPLVGINYLWQCPGAHPLPFRRALHPVGSKHGQCARRQHHHRDWVHGWHPVQSAGLPQPLLPRSNSSNWPSLLLA